MNAKISKPNPLQNSLFLISCAVAYLGKDLRKRPATEATRKERRKGMQMKLADWLVLFFLVVTVIIAAAKQEEPFYVGTAFGIILAGVVYHAFPSGR